MINFKRFFSEKFISPFVSRVQQQNALNKGPDIAMTSGDINNTFPSTIKTVKIKLPKKIKKKKV